MTKSNDAVVLLNNIIANRHLQNVDNQWLQLLRVQQNRFGVINYLSRPLKY